MWNERLNEFVFVEAEPIAYLKFSMLFLLSPKWANSDHLFSSLKPQVMIFFKKIKQFVYLAVQVNRSFV